jgi:hypothetical protein
MPCVPLSTVTKRTVAFSLVSKLLVPPRVIRKQRNTLASTAVIRGLLGFTKSVIVGASVAKWLAHLPFTSEAAGSSLSENFLNATRTQSSCEKSKSQRSAESRGFPPGTPVSSHRES